MDIRAILMGVSFAVMWASAFTTTRMIVTEAPPLLALSLRFALSGAIGILIAGMMGETWRNLSRFQWRAVIILGICQNAIYLGLNWIAMQWIEAGLASIIAATMPLMVAAMGWAFMREKLPVIGFAGLVLGLIGVTIIMGARLQGGSDPVGIVLGFIAAAALAVATLSVRGASSGGNVMMIVGLQMLVGAGSLIVIAPFFETWDVVLSGTLAVAFTYTVIVPGLVATWIWFLLVQRIGAVRAATFHFLSPFFGVLIGAFVLGEKLGLSDVIGVGIIMVGILAVQLSKSPAEAPPIKRPPPA